MNKELKVYVDMDGVLTDFNKKIKEITGSNPSELKASKLWTQVHIYNQDVEPFFESLDLMSDALQLWNFVISNFANVEILTATGTTPRDAAQQKVRWADKNLPNKVVVNTVRKSSEKAAFATPKSVLIDDRPHSIDPWLEAQGIGILHTSASESIKELKALI